MVPHEGHIPVTEFQERGGTKFHKQRVVVMYMDRPY